jgi:hypothetical protein
MSSAKVDSRSVAGSVIDWPRDVVGPGVLGRTPTSFVPARAVLRPEAPGAGTTGAPARPPRGSTDVPLDDAEHAAVLIETAITMLAKVIRLRVVVLIWASPG